MEQARPPVIFLGPSLPLSAAKDICDAVYLPPAAQGSIVSAVQRYEPRSLLIIDGVFQSAPAVRHKEILWAMSRGVRVLGAASMGALRAAELHGHGMIGIGLIYRWYRRYAFAPDDAVAVLHMPDELGSAAMTLALIDLVQTLKGAERRGIYVMDPAPAERGVQGAGTVHHVAWTAPDGEHAGWIARVREAGGHPTTVIDRQYFLSIYFNEPGGVLFEIATPSPGFADDEDPDHLGEALRLPPQYEPYRERIEEILVPLDNPRTRVAPPAATAQENR